MPNLPVDMSAYVFLPLPQLKQSGSVYFHFHSSSAKNDFFDIFFTAMTPHNEGVIMGGHRSNLFRKKYRGAWVKIKSGMVKLSQLSVAEFPNSNIAL